MFFITLFKTKIYYFSQFDQGVQIDKKENINKQTTPGIATTNSISKKGKVRIK
jgi:hypothetical protein